MRGALVGCDGLGEPSASRLRADLSRVQANIESLTASPRAAEIASCRAVGYGSKPCGGPTRYVITSIETTDLSRLNPLLDRYTALEGAYTRREGVISDCMITPVPPVTLRDGMCTLGR